MKLNIVRLSDWVAIIIIAAFLLSLPWLVMQYLPIERR